MKKREENGLGFFDEPPKPKKEIVPGAILEYVAENGSRFNALIVSVNTEKVTCEINGQEYTLPSRCFE